MRTFRYVVLLAIAGALLATTALAAPTKSIPITGKYAGTASTKSDGGIANISASGKGSASVIGAGKIQGAGTADSSQQPCVPFAGTGTITGIAGTVLTYKVPTGASGCGDEGGHVFSIKGYFKIIKATGKLAKATGSLKFTGVYDRDGGTFSIKVAGTLIKK